MPKVRRGRSPSIDCSRSHPYPSCSRNVELHKPMNLLGSVDEMKEWDDSRCPICMEPPHNGVLLRCSSHEKGCRPYMCNTSYRHSNCLDQFCKSFASHLSSAILEQIPFTNTASSATLEEIPLTSTVSNEYGSYLQPERLSQYGSHLQPKLICPLCRGEIYGYTVWEPARKYMNSKPRSCSLETCEFQGTYPELRKHARSEHPSVRPSEVDPSQQSDWLRMEEEWDLDDLFSSIGASSSTQYQSDDTIQPGPGGFADFMTMLYEIMSSIEDVDQVISSMEDVNRRVSLLSSSRPRMPLQDRRSGTISRVSNVTQTNQSARWRSNLPSVHQPERIHRGRWRSNLSSFHDAEANRTARWRTNSPTSSRIPRDVHQYYRELSPGFRTSSMRMYRDSRFTQTNPRSNISSFRRIPGHRLRWRDQRWSTYNNQQ